MERCDLSRRNEIERLIICPFISFNTFLFLSVGIFCFTLADEIPLLVCLLLGSAFILCGLYFAVTTILFMIWQLREYGMNELGIYVRYTPKNVVFFPWDSITQVCVTRAHYVNHYEQMDDIIWCSTGEAKNGPPSCPGYPNYPKYRNNAKYECTHFRSVFTLDFTSERLEMFRKYYHGEIPDYRGVGVYWWDDCKVGDFHRNSVSAMEKCYPTRKQEIGRMLWSTVYGTITWLLILIGCGLLFAVGTLTMGIAVLSSSLILLGLAVAIYGTTYLVWTMGEWEPNAQGLLVRCTQKKTVFFPWNTIKQLCICPVYSGAPESKQEKLIWCTIDGEENAPPAAPWYRNRKLYAFFHKRTVMTMAYTPEHLEAVKRYYEKKISIMEN